MTLGEPSYSCFADMASEPEERTTGSSKKQFTAACGAVVDRNATADDLGQSGFLEEYTSSLNPDNTSKVKAVMY